MIAKLEKIVMWQQLVCNLKIIFFKCFHVKPLIVGNIIFVLLKKDMETNNIPCATCKMSAKYDKNPKSVIACFWHWHTGFCPGWNAYLKVCRMKNKKS